MVDPDFHYVLDLNSGTFFPIGSAVVIRHGDLEPDEIEALEEGSDSDRNALGTVKGTFLVDLLDL